MNAADGTEHWLDADQEFRYAFGLSGRKRRILKRFLGGARPVGFIDSAAQIPPGAELLLWGSRSPPSGLASSVRIVRIEDGFLRSAGLGADLVRPLSWIMDRQGIYYDATRPSDLETILLREHFSASLLDRAQRLRERIVALGLSKYNVGGTKWARPNSAAKVVLVTGQVESDASIRYGAPGIKTNLSLVRAARAESPDAYIIYKPHPDVQAGLRASGLGDKAIADWCDEIVADAPIADLLSQVDDVHVMTSLSGFEALLRGRRVVCHGQPFYAGWGLTDDRIPIARRTRRLSIDELVAGTLIRYPLYISRSGRRISPEQAVDELATWRRGVRLTLPGWREACRFVLRRVVGVY